VSTDANHVLSEAVSETYIHGYHPQENERLQDQAGTLIDLLHFDTAYPGGSAVLEAGCGVGAQTVTLAPRSLMLDSYRLTSPQIRSPKPSEGADHTGLINVECQQADIFALPFDPQSFDHVPRVSRPPRAWGTVDLTALSHFRW
jgi:hypothetical protein